MALEPGPERQDFRLVMGGPALAMHQGAVELLNLATRIRGAGIAAQKAASRNERLGAGGLEHDAKSQQRESADADPSDLSVASRHDQKAAELGVERPGQERLSSAIARSALLA